MIEESLRNIREKICAAALRAGRDEKAVKLIAVSKTKPAEMISEAYAAGQRLFGENHAQELVAKKPLLPPDIEWHFIGNLQRNKVKYVVGQAALIHSVNSPDLIKEIEKAAAKRGLKQNILLEVNVAGEETKQGADPEVIPDLVRLCSAMPHLRLCGLMTVAPISDDPEESRPVFRRLANMLNELKTQAIDPASFKELSMGMSGDFETAAEEGATYVRVGSLIFGPRKTFPA